MQCNGLAVPDVWDAEVHEMYGEELYYVFVGLTRPSPERLVKASNVYDKFVDELRAALSIAGLSMYSLFGSYDTVIRAWCNEVDAYKLYLHLQGSDLVRQYRYYWCKSCEYLWAAERGTPLDKAELRRLRNSDVLDVQSGHNLAREEAAARGLLLSRPDRASGASYIKFFSHIPLTLKDALHEDSDAFSSLWQELKSGVLSAAAGWSGVQELTLAVLGRKVSSQDGGPKYLKNSDDIKPAAVLVKGIVPGTRMAEILPFTFAFASRSHQLRGASETYLVASADDRWTESDDITVTRRVSLSVLEEVKTICGLTAGEIVAIQPGRCNWVYRQICEHRHIVDLELLTPRESVFVSWLRAYLTNDNEQAFRALSIIPKIEGYLSICGQRLLGQIKGAWYPHSIEHLFESELGAMKQMGRIVINTSTNGKESVGLGRPDMYTLPDWMNILRRIDQGALEAISEGYVSEKLGKGWDEILDRLMPDGQDKQKGLRNAYAHGRMLEPLPVKEEDVTQYEELTHYIAELAWLIHSIRKMRDGLRDGKGMD